jgi:polyisoprenoid-binding protein YceI
MKRIARTLLALSAAAFFAPVAPAAAQTTWDIDSGHSQTTFAVRHLMVATVRGEFGKTTGTVEFDGKDLGTLKVDATIDVNTINTREQKRDDHLRSPDFFDVAKFPTMTFKSKRAEAAGAGKFRLVGDLTMKGVTKEVVLNVEGPVGPVKGARGETRVGATATTTINRKDFGVTWNRNLDGGGVVVGDEVQVTIDLSLVQKAPAAASASK